MSHPWSHQSNLPSTHLRNHRKVACRHPTPHLTTLLKTHREEAYRRPTNHRLRIHRLASPYHRWSRHWNHRWNPSCRSECYSPRPAAPRTL